jgi:glycolate oxidase
MGVGSMAYRKIDEQIVNELRSIVGTKNVFTDAEKMEPYSHDAVTGEEHVSYPEAVVLPATTEEVAAVVRLANRELFR